MSELRRLMMAKKLGGGLPPGVVLYDKLIANNNGLIDLGFKANSTIEFETKFEILYSGSNHDGALFGARLNGANSDTFIFWANRANGATKPTTALAVGNSSKIVTLSYEGVITSSYHNKQWLLNDISNTITINNTAGNRNMTLLGFINDNRRFRGSVYPTKFWLDGGLIRDTHPCTYFGEVGIWDFVTNSFYGNTIAGGQLSVAND